MKRELLSVAMVGVTMVAGAVLSMLNVRADDAVSTATITVPVACTMAGSGMDSHTAEVPNGTTVENIGTTTMKIYCNDNEGFSVYASGFSDDTLGNTYLRDATLGQTDDILTGTTFSGANSAWAMKIGATAGAYASTIAGSTGDTEKQTGDTDYSDWAEIPSAYTRVAYRNSGTDVDNESAASAEGSSITATYKAFINSTQKAGTYVGKVKFTMVHPANEDPPLSPQPASPGCINYFANASDALGTMGCQFATDNAEVTLLASNFSRTGYGFAGWSDKYDYATNSSANFYGPQEKITVPEGTTANGLSLYAVWVKSAGNLQDTIKVATLCGTGTGSLIKANEATNILSQSITALSDARDNNTYAIAKLADGKCWMIENLRLDDSATLTLANTNNPLNDGTNVTLKHSYSDTETHNTLSASQDPTTTAWCQSDSASCDDQSMLFTGNTTNRKTNSVDNSGNIYSYGNYYNWYSATAGRGTYSFSTNNNSVTGDLCPAGWHLPIGGRKANVDISDFWKLSRATIGADPANFANDYFYYTGTPEGTDASYKMRAYPNNFVYSGNVRGGSVSNRGTNGSFWSSTVYSSNNAYNLYLSSSLVYPGANNSYKYYGRAVRCVVSGA